MRQCRGEVVEYRSCTGGGGAEERWYRRQVVQGRGGTGEKSYTKEVVQKIGGTGERYHRGEVVQEKGGAEDRWYRRNVEQEKNTFIQPNDILMMPFFFLQLQQFRSPHYQSQRA